MNVLASYRRSPLGLFPGQPTPRLYDCVVEALRSRHYSRRSEEAYLHWIRRFLAFHGGTHPRELAESDVNRFLTRLAVSENVAASTQNQALAAVLFLYQQVLEQPLDRIDGVVRARKPKRLPAELTRDEVRAILAELDGVPHLVCALLYGAELRLLEGLALRVRRQHEADLRSGLGQAPLPDALARKYPNAGSEWGWQWYFPPRPTTWTERRTSGIVTISTNRSFKRRDYPCRPVGLKLEEEYWTRKK